MEMKSKKGIITVIEMSLLVLLFGSITVYISLQSDFDYTNQESIESSLDFFYNSNDFHEVIILEDLTSVSLTEDWSEFSAVFNKSYLDYELIVSNISHSKKIFICKPKYSKINSQRIFSIHNNTEYEFRTLTLGVCF